MKQIKNILIASTLLMGTFSCTKELNEDPFNSIDASGAFSSADRIAKSAVGMYNALQNANYFGGRVLIYADIRGIDASPSTFFGNMALYNTLQSSDGTVAGAWQGAYRTIYECNSFLKNFEPNASLVSADLANQYRGEAKFIRSLCYFYLVNLWAQPYSFTTGATHAGVPLVIEAAGDPFAASNNLPRATVKQVYDQMEADFKDAENWLPLTYTDAYTRVSRATKGAARAMLMRLYLYKGDYTNAATYANTIMTSAIYSLNPSPITCYRTYTTAESIFSVAHDGGDNPNTNNSIGQHYGVTRRADIPVTTDFVALFEATDTRKKAIGSDSLVQFSGGAYWTRKYNAGATDWVPVARYSEVLLTRAEALARNASGTTADATAVSLLNTVRTRASASTLAPANKNALIDAIMLERRRELAFEGQGSLDFQRTGQDIPAHGVVPAQAFGTDFRVLPVPLYDMQKNPNLVQNPGY